MLVQLQLTLIYDCFVLLAPSSESVDLNQQLLDILFVNRIALGQFPVLLFKQFQFLLVLASPG